MSRGLPRDGAGARRKIPCGPGALRYSKHFLGHERSAQKEVKSAKIEDFHPETFVGQARAHDKTGPNCRLVHFRQDEFPITIG